MPLSPDNLITAISTVAAGIAGGLFTWLTSRSTERTEQMKRELQILRASHRKAWQQVQSYHALEGLYAAELELYNAGRALAVKAEFRDRVESAGYVRPHKTENDAKMAIEEAEAMALR